LKNAEALKTIATNYLELWPIQSGFIRGALGSRIDTLPAEAVKAMDELDELAARENTFTDHELGYSLGLRVRMLSQVVFEALRLYAPDVFQLIGAFS
jgi:hypothetical protein